MKVLASQAASGQHNSSVSQIRIQAGINHVGKGEKLF